MRFEFDRHEINLLIEVLYRRGVCYLMGSGEPASEEEAQIDDLALVQRLAACNYPLVECALISLFILHPDLAPAVTTALQRSEDEVAETIAVLILATLYMQQWWLFRLAFAPGRLPSFPATPFTHLWKERHLPPPEQGYGLDGLLALQEYEQRRHGLPLNFLDGWQNQVNHLLAQEEAHQRQLSNALKQTLQRVSLAYMAQSTQKEQIA